jgi:hypothetical protein
VLSRHLPPSLTLSLNLPLLLLLTLSHWEFLIPHS